MEKLTNDRNKFLNQIKLELLEYEVEENWKEVFTYVEVPFFLQYAFSYNWSVDSANSKYRLKRREWKAKYDHSRFDKGIYNLNRLAIVEKEILINSIDERYFNSIDWNKINTVEFKGIILDGLDCEFQMKDIKKSFSWNIDEEMNKELTELIYTIRAWKREIE